MAKNKIDGQLKRLEVMYYDPEDNPIPGKPLPNLNS